MRLFAALSVLLVAGSCGGASPSMNPGSTLSAACTNGTSASALPAPRTYGRMFAAGRGRGVFLLGGETGAPPDGHGLGDLWVYRQPGKWVQLAPEPSAIFGPALFETAGNRLVVFGALGPDFQPTLQDLVYDPAANRWQTRVSRARPSNILGAQFAYRSKSDRAVLFGGIDPNTGVLNDDTWVYDPKTDTWTKQTPVTSPPARAFGAMAYDEEADRFVLFGGGGTGGGLGDTWLYDLVRDEWTEMKPAQSPPGRAYHSLAYDPTSNRTILFGGVIEETANQAFNSEKPLGDTWAYHLELNTWKDLSPPAAPSARGWQAMTYDADNGKILLFGGGVRRGQPTSDFWQFDAVSYTWARP